MVDIDCYCVTTYGYAVTEEGLWQKVMPNGRQLTAKMPISGTSTDWTPLSLERPRRRWSNTGGDPWATTIGGEGSDRCGNLCRVSRGSGPGSWDSPIFWSAWMSCYAVTKQSTLIEPSNSS